MIMMEHSKYGIYQPFFEALSQHFPVLSEQGMMFQFQLPLLSISVSQDDEEKLSWITDEFSKKYSTYCGNSLSRLSVVDEHWKDAVEKWEDNPEHDFLQSFESEQWREDPIQITAEGSTQNMSKFFKVEKYQFKIRIENIDLFDVVRGKWFSEKAFMQMI